MMQFPQYFPQTASVPFSLGNSSAYNPLSGYSYASAYSSPFGTYASSYAGSLPPAFPWSGPQYQPPVYSAPQFPAYPPIQNHRQPMFPVGYPPIGSINNGPFGRTNIGPYAGANFGPFAGANVNFGTAGNNNDITNQLLLSQLFNNNQAPREDNSMMMLMMMLLLGNRNNTVVQQPVAAAAATAAPTVVQQPAQTVVQQPAQTVVQQPRTVQVQDVATQIQALPKSPLVADLNGDGVKTSDRLVQYDIDGDGQLDNINDIAQGDGLFSIRGGKDGKDLLGQFTDVDGDGRAESYQDGFEALKALAARAQKEGLINGDNTLDANEIASLEKAYGLGVKKDSFGAQSVSLSQAGIKSINLATGEKQYIQNFDGRGNDTLRQGGAQFTRADGTTGGYEDVFFLKK